ncbi:MAG: hypothetical protein ACYC0X_25295 [Pirellulaceae bacterium]
MKPIVLWSVIATCSVLLAGFMIYRTFRPPYEPLPETGATLEGTISYNNKPIPQALIIVVGQDWSATSFISEPGKYKVENAPVGRVQIAVHTAAAVGRMQGAMMAAAQAKSKGGAAKSVPQFVSVPNKYADPTTSGIETTVEKGITTFAIGIAD